MADSFICTSFWYVNTCDRINNSVGSAMEAMRLMSNVCCVTVCHIDHGLLFMWRKTCVTDDDSCCGVDWCGFWQFHWVIVGKNWLGNLFLPSLMALYVCAVITICSTIAINTPMIIPASIPAKCIAANVNHTMKYSVKNT